MSKLGAVVEAVEKHGRFVLEQVKRARTDEKFGRELLGRWNDIKAKIPITRTPTGLPLPRLALPEIDETGEIARYLFGEGLPGEFPYLNGAYREMYLEPVREIESFERNDAVAAGVSPANRIKTQPARLPPQEEPTRLFSGLMLAEDTNERFHYLTRHQRTHRLSTAFDGPTLYGIDSDADGVFGKVGEGGVAIDTVEDMVRLYDGFDLGSPNFSASMTISGPAPIIMAMYIAAATRRFGPKVVPKLRGTIQADIFKEVQAQNETIFPIEPSLRFLTDMVEFTTREMPRWYPISISGYHIGEAGSTPVQQAAYTLSNGFAYAEMFAGHGQAILLEESGIFKHTMNMLSGSPGMKAVERAVEAAILDEFREIERLGGVLAAVEERYQRSQIQNAAHRYEQQIYDGTRPIIGLNRYRDGGDDIPEVKPVRTPRAKQQLQVDRLAKFKKKNAEKAKRALDNLAAVVERGENCFPTLLEAVEVCSLGQITGRL